MKPLCISAQLQDGDSTSSVIVMDFVWHANESRLRI